MSLDKKLITLGGAAAGRSADLGSDPFSDGNCICWIEFDSDISDGTSTQTLTANGSITLTTDQVIFGSASGYFDSTGVKNISGKDSITFPAGDSGLSDLDGWTNSNDLSLSVWIYWEGLNQPSSEQGAATILAITNGTGIQCRLRWNNISDPNKPNLNSFGDSMIGDTALNVGAWNHLVFISPATDSATESAEIYLNGTRVGYAVNWTRSSRNYYDSIGAEFNTVNNNSQYFNGYMSNLRIFKDRLTVSEVESLYNEGLSPTYADYLVVAGGGGGGNYSWGAGGGAGGLKTSYGSTSGGGSGDDARLTLTSGNTYTITVGAAGGVGSNGSDSSITVSGVATINTSGGGAGGKFNGLNGASGGSGGGGGGGSSAGSGAAGTGGQGFAGGNAAGNVSGQCAGGGGGASAVGGTAAANSSGDGGAGVSVSITGTSLAYAGGGGGGVGRGDQTTETGGTGGSGVGGNGGRNTYYGGSNSADPTAGATNTGSGGGGGKASGNSANTGGGAAGGSGVVILRMATSVYSGTTTGSPTVTTDGSDTILKFTGSGTYVH